MAKTTAKRGGATVLPGRAPGRPAASKPEFEPVDPRWVINALVITIGFAIVCAYLALCLLVYQGSWQLMLKPSAKVERTPTAAGLPFDAVRFDAAETGVPRLAGWWIPGSSATAPTLLLIHDGHGSLAATVPVLAVLHATGANVFAFDFRGFGESEPTRPGEDKMAQDTAAALAYLIDTRHLAPAQIVPVGIGLGASLAAGLVHAHPELPGVIIDNPDLDARARVLAAEKSRLLPVNLLIREHFELASVLRDTRQPRLLITGGPDDAEPSRDQATLTLYRSLPDPKMTLVLDAPGRPGYPADKVNAELVQTVTRFLDQYLPGHVPGATLLPAH